MIHYFEAVGHRLTAENLPEILSALAWPIVILVGLFLLRRALNQLVHRLEKASWGDKGLDFTKSAMDQARSKPALIKDSGGEPTGGATNRSVVTAPDTHSIAIAPAINSGKVGNIYWLAHDLMFALDAVLRPGAGDARAIAHIFRQANHHMKALGMRGSPLQIKLERLASDSAVSLEKDWTAERRAEVARELFSIAREFGEKNELAQADFSPDPASTD